MKRMLPLVLLTSALLIAVPAAAQECAHNVIGLWADEEATTCEGDIEVYVMFELYVILHHDIPDPISQVSFRIEGLPDEDSAEGLIMQDWGGFTTQGDPWTGMSIDFDPSILEPGPLLLGVLQFFMINPTWIVGPDYQMTVVDAELWDLNEQHYELIGGHFVFFPSWPVEFCSYASYADWLKATEFSPETGSVVQGEFPFAFTVASWTCFLGPEYPVDYTGRVEVEGAQVAEFSGAGTEDHLITLSAEGFPPGTSLDVDVLVNSDNGESTHCHLVYLVDDPTHVGTGAFERGTISTIKALYR